MFEWIRFGFTALFLLAGIIVLAIAFTGVYRFRYVLNRMHAAAMIDTLAVLFITIGLIIASGADLLSLKLLLVMILLWITSPVSTHLIARLETTTSEDLDKHMEVSTKK